MTDEMSIASKRLMAVLKRKGLADVDEGELYSVLRRNWWPYAQSEPSCTAATLDRLLAVAVQEWSRKGRVRGRFLAFLTVRLRDYGTNFRPAAPQYYIARQLPLDWPHAQ